MSPAPITPLASFNLSRLKELLSLLAALRQFREPFTSSEGLRQAIEIAARLAELLGVEPAWIEPVRSVLANERVFRILLAIVQYLAEELSAETAGALAETNSDSPRGA